MPLKEHRYITWNPETRTIYALKSQTELRERNNFSELLPRLCGRLSMNESHFGLDPDSFPCERSFVPLVPTALYSSRTRRDRYSLEESIGFEGHTAIVGISADISFIVHA